MEHSEEILNVECLEYSSPSWTRPILANDQAVKWAKGCLRLTKMQWDSTEKRLNSSGSQGFRH